MATMRRPAARRASLAGRRQGRRQDRGVGDAAGPRRAGGGLMLTILSLFDVSGVWASAFELFGCSVWQVDLKLGDDVRGWSAQSLLRQLEGIESIDGVIGAPPCTAFARSGARAWAAKDGDGRTQAAVELVRQQLRVVDLFRPRFWAAENPVGRIDRLVPELGTATLAFDPCDFAGWTTAAPPHRSRPVHRPGVVDAGDRRQPGIDEGRAQRHPRGLRARLRGRPGRRVARGAHVDPRSAMPRSRGG